MDSGKYESNFPLQMFVNLPGLYSIIGVEGFVRFSITLAAILAEKD